MPDHLSQSVSSKTRADDRHEGPIYEYLVTETRIEIDPRTLKIKDYAVAEILSQYRDGWKCEACGLHTSNPFHVAREEVDA